MIRGIISPRREVEAHQVFGQAPGAGFSLQLVDQVHDVEEAAPGPVAELAIVRHWSENNGERRVHGQGAARVKSVAAAAAADRGGVPGC